MIQKEKNWIHIIKIGKSLLIGGVTSFVVIEFYRFWGIVALWGATGAISGLLMPALLDAWKGFKDDQSTFESNVDKRIDAIEQALAKTVLTTTIDAIYSDLAIARAIAEQAFKTADTNREVSMETSRRVNELFTSDVIFKLTQGVTSVQVQLEILKKQIEIEKRNS